MKKLMMILLILAGGWGMTACTQESNKTESTEEATDTVAEQADRESAVNSANAYFEAQDSTATTTTETPR